MSRFGDMMTIAKMLNDSKSEKPSKPWKKAAEEKDPIAVLIEFQERMDRYNKWQKDQEKLNKKEEKKETAKGLLPADWSVAKQTAFFALAGPPLAIGYLFGIIILVRQLSQFIVRVHG
jgi:hypothetical protein